MSSSLTGSSYDSSDGSSSSTDSTEMIQVKKHLK
jgi:hypothetical protein